MSTTARLMTAEELFELPTYVQGNDYRYELIRGELKKMSPTKPLHGIFTAEITAELIMFVRARNLGRVFGAETGFLVERDPDTVLGVDAAFVSHERLAIVESFDKFFPFAPDLAIEVLSPGNTVDEIDEKSPSTLPPAHSPFGSSIRSGASSWFTAPCATYKYLAKPIRSTEAACCPAFDSISPNCSRRATADHPTARL